MPSPEKCATIMDCEPLEGWIRGVGFTIFYIGLFYLFAGLADNKQFAAVSVFMRCIFVTTLFSGFLGNSGYIPSFVAGYFALADITFSLLTYNIYQKSVADEEEEEDEEDEE